MSTVFVRRPLDDLLLATLAGELSKPVGDMVIPAGAGWAGRPNAPSSSFTPYVVLVSLTAARSIGPFGDSQSDWQMPYMLESFGASRAQCQLMADDARIALDTLSRTVIQLGAAHYGVQQIRIDSIGAVNRVAIADPAFYGQQDGVSVWLTKEKT